MKVTTIMNTKDDIITGMVIDSLVKALMNFKKIKYVKSTNDPK